MNSMNHVSGSLHLVGTALHTVIMNVLHAEFHHEMLKSGALKQHVGGHSLILSCSHSIFLLSN